MLMTDPTLAEARRQGMIHHSWRGTPLDLLAMLRERVRRHGVPGADEVLGVFLRSGAIADADLRELARKWARAALDGFVVSDKVAGAIGVLRQVEGGILPAPMREVAETLAGEDVVEPRLRYVDQEAARVVAGLAAADAGDAASRVAARAATLLAHRRGHELGLYDPARDCGGYSPDWRVYHATLERALDDVAELLGGSRHGQA